jgi:lysyl-tRNA synthetase class 1
LTYLGKIAPKDSAERFVEEKLRAYGYLQKDQRADEDLKKRLEYGFNWNQDFGEIKETLVSLKQEEKNAISTLLANLKSEDDPDKMQNAIFNAAKNNGVKPGAFFKLLYTILLGTPQGPRLGPYVLDMGKQTVIAALQRAINDET